MKQTTKNNDMKKELKIEIPEGYEIDKENSTFEKIVFKEKTIRWRDDTSKKIKGYLISAHSNIMPIDGLYNDFKNYNVFATKALAKRALAMARISQILKNDDRFGSVVFYGNTRREVHELFIKRTLAHPVKICIRSYSVEYLMPNRLLMFNTEWQADLFLQENEDLLMDYFMLNK